MKIRKKIVLALAGGLAATGIAAGAGYYVVGGDAPVSIPLVAQAEVPVPEGAGEGEPANQEPNQPAGQDLPSNLVVDQAVEWGVSTCLPQIAFISDFLTSGTLYSSESRGGSVNADQQIFSSTIAAELPENNIRNFSSMTVAPTPNGCAIVYEITAYFPNSCEAVRAEYFELYAQPVEFGDVASLYITEDETASLYMMPTEAGGCLTMQKEVLF